MGENLGNREPNLLSLFMQIESIQLRYLRHKHSQQPSRGSEQQRGECDSQMDHLPPSNARENHYDII